MSVSQEKPFSALGFIACLIFLSPVQTIAGHQLSTNVSTRYFRPARTVSEVLTISVLDNSAGSSFDRKLAELTKYYITH